ncbi:MAG: error-prone DNA polymerase, partial [Pseudomonadota bacterium]
PYETAQEAISALTWLGAEKRYPDGVPAEVRKLLEHELALIDDLDYAPYFLTVYDIVRHARSQGILCQGRGSAANSAVCYCLEITSVNPHEIGLLFERFVSAERGEPPDIDVDFEHERREEVIQYIYEKYGRERAAIAGTVQTYRAKGAIRDVGKALGLSEDVIMALSGTVWGWSEDGVLEKHVREAGLDPDDRTIAMALTLARALIGFPRHLGQHSGGFVITHGRLDEIVPIDNAAMEDRTYIEWDKDDLDVLGILKIDVLGLGMLTCIRKAFDLLKTHYGVEHTLASIPPDDPDVYDMIDAADTHGVFQIESRAQMSMLPRLRPRCFYDLVIEVAIVRPGPIQGDMVHPYLRRRQKLEPVEYPSEDLKAVLEKTLGVPLFQEQAMQIAIVGAGFTPGEADMLRRAMATFRKMGTIQNFRERFISGMVKNGYEEDFAERCFSQIEGFGTYGFPESHAASFALLVYVSCWLKYRYPEVFTCAIINSQPMGFYSSATLARDLYQPYVTALEKKNYEVRPPDVNKSDWHCTLEPHEGEDHFAVRLGFRLGKGLKEADIDHLIAQRGDGYDTVRALYQRTDLSVPVLKTLADMDAFRSLGIDRRQALWEVSALGGLEEKRAAVEDLPLFAQTGRTDLQREPDVALPVMSVGEHVIRDYASTKLSLRAHPMGLLRPIFDRQRFLKASDLASRRNGARIRVAGVVTIRQRPGTASGVVFATIEDETGAIQLIIWPKVFERHRRIAMSARLIAVEGTLQIEQSVIHVVAHSLVDRSGDMAVLSDDFDDAEPPLSNADEVKRPAEDPRWITARRTEGVADRTVSILPKGRNFR